MLRKKRENKDRWQGIDIETIEDSSRYNHAKRREMKLIERKVEMGRCPHDWARAGKDGKKQKYVCTWCEAEKIRAE